MKKTNILFTISAMVSSGTMKFVLEAVRHLDKEKYNIIVFSDNNKKGKEQAEFEKNGAKVIYSNVHRFKHPIKYIRQIKQLLSDERIDIIHACDDLSMAFMFPVVPKNIKFVAHSHNTYFRFTKSKILSSLALRMFRKSIIKKSNVRLACGEDAGRALYGNSSFVVIPNGIDIKRFEYSAIKRKTVRKQLGIDNSATVLLTIGRLEKEKNQSFMIDVFRDYQKTINNSYLLIVGDGADKEMLNAKIKEYGLGKRCLIVPSRPDVSDIYSAGDLFLLTSLFEGLPIVSIEAQINGMQCVFSDSISKEADHSGRTLFLPLQNGSAFWAKQIARCSLDRIECNDDTINKYDVSHVVDRLDDIYSGLIEESSK